MKRIVLSSALVLVFAAPVLAVTATETNVEDYGATGTPANDTSAIQAAIDAVSAAGGGIVRFPPKQYDFTRIIAKPNVILAGAGQASTILKCTDLSAGSAIKRADDNSVVFYFGLRDLLLCTATSNVASAQASCQDLIGLNLCGMAYGDFRNLAIQGFGEGGIILARAEGGTEGLGFTNTTQDGNYHSFYDVRPGGNGAYNTAGAAVWFKYKANSTKWYGTYFKGGGTVECIRFDYGNDNSFFGGTWESVTRGVRFGSEATSNLVVGFRAEGVSGAVLTADAPAASTHVNTVGDIHQSSAATLTSFNVAANVRLLTSTIDDFLTGEKSTTNLTTTSDRNFVGALGIKTRPDGRFYFKAPGYSGGATPTDGAPHFQFWNTIQATVANQSLGEFEVYNNDTSTGAAGVNAIIRAKAFDAAGQSGWSILTGKGGAPTEKIEINNDVKVTAPLVNTSGRTENARVDNGATVTVSTSDHNVHLNYAGAEAVTLSGSPTLGRTVTIYDMRGDAGLYPATVTPSSGTIVGLATYPLDATYGALTFQGNGTNWAIRSEW